MKLTATGVKNAKTAEKSYKLSDGRNLYLLVATNGSKYWRSDYRFAGKRKTLALGIYPDVGLGEARRRHQLARETLAKGVDPSQEKKAKRSETRAASSNSFKAVAEEWWDKKMADKSHSYRSRTLRILEKDLYPVLGHLPVNEIDPPLVLAALRKVEQRTIDIAHRAKQTAGQIFRYAVAAGKVRRDPTIDLTGALSPRLKRHHAAVTDPSDVARLMRSISSLPDSSLSKAALRLSALLFQRPGEIRHMEWNEINFLAREWRIPANKMKMRRDHVVPLSTAACSILEQLRKTRRGNRFVFQSTLNKDKPMSDNTMRKALRVLGYSNEMMTPHGFRAMARTLLDEELEYRVDLIEHQLAHAVKDPTGRAYNRTKFLKQRVRMMEDWASYLASLESALDGNQVDLGQSA